jgi:3-methylcrotonyl-CoA carboxylase alpha subunit
MVGAAGPAAVKITPLGDGRYEVATDAGRTIAYGARRGGQTWVFLRGRVYVLEGTDNQSRRARHHDETAMSAPMPATVVAINVTAGQAVKAGDVLVVLEAMKMELAVTAPHDGRIRDITCRVGELVQPDVPLVAFDEPESSNESR